MNRVLLSVRILPDERCLPNRFCYDRCEKIKIPLLIIVLYADLSKTRDPDQHRLIPIKNKAY